MTAPSPTLRRVSTVLRHGLHVLSALLMAFGLFRSWQQGVLDVRIVALAGIVVVAYTWGSRRRMAGRAGLICIAVAAIGWVGLVVHAHDFLWLEFPLVFLLLHRLPWAVALPGAAAAWAVAAWVPAWLHSQYWTPAAAVGPAIGTGFAVAMYYAYAALKREAHRYQVLNARLHAMQAELAVSENLAGRLAERERISREIHDTVAQGLSSIVLLSRAARGRVRRGDDPTAQLETMEAVAQDALTQARSVVKELATPPALTDALRELVDSFAQRGASLGEETSFELHLPEESTESLPAEVSSALERVAREGLNNVVRHARARRAVLSLNLYGEEVSLDVADDGIGPAGATRAGEEQAGFGLRGLRSRVEELGGTLTVTSRPEGGTVLTAALPLAESTTHQTSGQSNQVLAQQVAPQMHRKDKA